MSASSFSPFSHFQARFANYVRAGIPRHPHWGRGRLDQFKTTSEHTDDLPLLTHWLKRMQVHAIIDRVVAPVHGNREGLSSTLYDSEL